MCAQLSQGGQSRKRRRQAIVCTECRRRKIACDRNSPCAQCIQSNSPCTYYNSYNSFAKADFADQDDSIKDHHTSPLAASQGIYALGSWPPLPPLQRNYQNTFHGAAEVGTLPTTTSADVGMQSSFDTRNIGSLSLPGSISIDTTGVPFPDVSNIGILGLDGVAGVTGLALTGSVQPKNMLPQESNRVVFHKSRFYPPSHWMSILERVIQYSPI